MISKRESVAGRWDAVRNKHDSVLSLVSSEVRSRVLQVDSNLEENTGGGLTKWFESSERTYLCFYVMFAEDCDYVHHFVTLRANKVLQGKECWSGFGGVGDKPDGTERFSTALELLGNWGKLKATGIWNFYSYWYQMQAAPDGKYWGTSFKPEVQPVIDRGQWICAEFMLKHNTPGQRDGEQTFWINGAMRGWWKDINWRKDAVFRANALTW